MQLSGWATKLLMTISSVVRHPQPWNQRFLYLFIIISENFLACCSWDNHSTRFGCPRQFLVVWGNWTTFNFDPLIILTNCNVNYILPILRQSFTIIILYVYYMYDDHSIPQLTANAKYPWHFDKVLLVVAPAGFWPRGQNPRRQHRSPRTCMYVRTRSWYQ